MIPNISELLQLSDLEIVPSMVSCPLDKINYQDAIDRIVKHYPNKKDISSIYQHLLVVLLEYGIETNNFDTLADHLDLLWDVMNSI